MVRLTTAQLAALKALEEHGDWLGRAHPNTLYALARMGYVETRERPSCTVARITAEGVEVLGSVAA